MSELAITEEQKKFAIWFDLNAFPALGGKSLMMHLFNRLDGAYPHWWNANFANQDAIDNWAACWAEAFEEAGIRPADIKAGIKACQSKFEKPPSCAEFVKVCKPSVDPFVVYCEAVAGVAARKLGEVGKWSHPAVYWSAVSIAHDLGTQTYGQIRGRWEETLREQMKKGEWSDIPASRLQLDAPGRSPLSRENAARMLEEIGASGILHKNSEHAYWYKDILAREKRGDKTVTLIMLKFAQEAANNHGYRIPT